MAVSPSFELHIQDKLVQRTFWRFWIEVLGSRAEGSGFMGDVFRVGV